MNTQVYIAMVPSLIDNRRLKGAQQKSAKRIGEKICGFFFQTNRFGRTFVVYFVIR